MTETAQPALHVPGSTGTGRPQLQLVGAAQTGLTRLSFPTGLARYPRILLGLLGVMVIGIVVYLVVPLPDGVHQGLYQVIATTGVIVGFLGLKWHHPARRRGWFLVLIGYAVWSAGDLMWTIESHWMPDRYPAPSDSLYLSAYLALGAGTLVLVRTRRAGRDPAALLDASIITAGAGVLVAVFLIAPLTHDSSLSLAGKITSSAYPLGDLFLLGVIARIYAAPGARTAAYRLLTGSLLATLVADAAWNLAVGISGHPISSDWIDVGWLAGYLLIGAAACVPSMTSLAEPAPDKAEAAPSVRRLLALGGGLALPAIALLLDGATGGGVLWPVIGIGSLLLSVLVLLRMIGLLRVVQVQAVRLAALARSDALTGAPNRRTWDHELSRACLVSREQQTSLCVAILDLDRFKNYNDTQGHQAGDRLLREAVAAWTEILPSDAMLARYGGEEFAVLFPGFDVQTAADALGYLRAVTPDGQTFSAGVALWDPETDPSTAIAAADEALYAAKRGGRDRIVGYGDSDPAPRSNPLPALTMVIQPIVDIATFKVTAHEALARFSGPDGVREVQDVFRRTYLGGDGDLLELAAVRSALALAGRPEGQDLYVNVTPRALTSGRFLAGLPTRLTGIVFELSETSDDVDLMTLSHAVTRLRATGARIALDDVGAGAGAQEFARLAALRPDIIKIDRSLVHGCAEDAGRTAVLRALVTYARDLGVATCAEGVEDVEDLRHLTTLGITHVQGYLLARASSNWHRQITPAVSQVSS
jgi:diguanylate cyclase (GGDEF)-like protein